MGMCSSVRTPELERKPSDVGARESFPDAVMGRDACRIFVSRIPYMCIPPRGICLDGARVPTGFQEGVVHGQPLDKPLQGMSRCTEF